MSQRHPPILKVHTGWEQTCFCFPSGTRPLREPVNHARMCAGPGTEELSVAWQRPPRAAYGVPLCGGVGECTLLSRHCSSITGGFSNPRVRVPSLLLSQISPHPCFASGSVFAFLSTVALSGGASRSSPGSGGPPRDPQGAEPLLSRTLRPSARTAGSRPATHRRPQEHGAVAVTSSVRIALHLVCARPDHEAPTPFAAQAAPAGIDCQRRIDAAPGLPSLARDSP